MLNGKYANLYSADNRVVGREGTNGLYAVGKYGIGADLKTAFEEKLRKMFECSSDIDGFQFISHMGGGTGSGTLSNMMQAAREEYPSRMLVNYSVFPYPSVHCDPL